MIIHISELDANQKQTEKLLKNLIFILMLGIGCIIIIFYNIYSEIKLNHVINPILIISVPIALLLVLTGLLLFMVNLHEINDNSIVIKNFWKKLVKNKRIPRMEMISYEYNQGNDYINFEISEGLFHLSLEILIPLGTFKYYVNGSLKKNNTKIKDFPDIEIINNKLTTIDNNDIDLIFLNHIFNEQKATIIKELKLLDLLVGNKITSKELIKQLSLWHIY